MRGEREGLRYSRWRAGAGLGAVAAAWAMIVSPAAAGSPPQESAEAQAETSREGEELTGTFPLEPGSYASRQAFSAVIKTPPLGRRQTGVTVSFALHEVTREGDGLIASTHFCSVEPIPFGGVKTTMPDAFVAAMPVPVAAVTVEGPEGGPWSVEFAEWTIVIGAELDDPTADPLPTDKKDERVTDPDADGKPGVTVHLSGMIKGRTYVTQRIVRRMRGTLTADGQLDGTIEGRAEQETLGASNPILSRFKATFLDETEARYNVFSWRSVPPGTTCEELVADRDDLFD